MLEAADGNPLFAGTSEADLEVRLGELASCTGVTRTGTGISRWRPGLVEGYVRFAQDPETELPKLIDEEGAPSAWSVPLRA